MSNCVLLISDNVELIGQITIRVNYIPYQSVVGPMVPTLPKVTLSCYK